MNRFILISAIVLLLSQSIFANEKQEEENNQTRFESLSKLTQVIGTVEKYYVDDIKLQEIVDKALKGLMQELDAHSTYLDKKSSKEMSIQTQGEFGGLGITVGMRDGALTVIAPIDGTPAYKAGVKAGDIILKIDDHSTLNMTLDEAVSLMRGKPKTPISLTLVREGKNKPLKIDIVRDIIKIQSVFSKTIENEDLLYVRISSFDRKVTTNLKKAIKENPKTKGIILDLRNNPGGLLTQAIGVVDLFVDEGIIVSQKGRNSEEEEKFNATIAETITDVPLVVLVNGGSASASEIVSGALQDHKRAVVIGEKTFGKGSVQAILPITQDRSENIKITIAKYYLPSGRTIQATGITPDVISHEGEVVAEKNAEFKLKEADLKKHLEVELDKENGVNKKSEEKEEDSKILTEEDIAKDNQLNTSIGILKSLIIMK
ncbi:S41 family peptidase [Halarcobacter bivalviorum]|uniref:Carboxyl-terminal protease family protein n=1 Tax=Halarcobacter bivalviorum TaxID=663364 RepID=A0AAX2ABM3_9BACT|nr:S41 family peptidase [Halarcobacter bivalviorum]AXH13259.1 carboxyl-terminal protease family protein [Halarcobacter bivalviorum]RXK10136.1 peptidase S41 [Halarcobacter bivalviorum]